MRTRLVVKLLVLALAIAGLSLVAPTAALAAPTSTTTTLSVDPASPVPEGTRETFIATVTNDPVGKVIFRLDGFAFDQTERRVENGVATTELTIGGARTHKISAEFVPDDATEFAGSSSGDQDYVVTAAPTPNTSTTLTVSPASPIVETTNPVLTATISPAGATGGVVFFDGETPINPEDPVAVESNGKAVVTTHLDAGTHQLSAAYTSDDPGNFDSSTSPAITYVVNAAPTPTQTTTTLQVTPASPAPAGTAEKLTATVSPAAAGTVTFKDGGNSLGTPAAVQSGTATLNVTLSPGSHSLTATFAPTDASAFTTSTSEVTTYTVSPTPSVTPTSTSLTAAPASPAEAGTSITFTASITPKTAAGTVQLKDGNTAVGEPSSVTNGSAQVATTALAKGSHSMTAVFTPTDAETFDPSTSPAITYVIAARPSVPTAIKATAGNTNATITWTAPADNGGTPITGYALQQSTTGGESWQDTAPGGTRTSTATSKVVTGLTNGTGYLFRVAAINAIGTSQYDQTESEVTPLAPASVVIGGTPAATTYGTKVTVTAKVTNSATDAAIAGAPVRLYQRLLPATTFSLVGTFTANSAGVASVARTATANTYYRWLYPGSTTAGLAYSAIRPMSTSFGVSAARTPASVRHGQSTTVYGTVAGGASGKGVYLQRYIGGKYTNIASTTLVYRTLPDGRRAVGFAFSTQLTAVGTYSFRVFAPGGASLNGGYSAVQSVTST